MQRLRGREISLLPQGSDALNPLVTVGGHITETVRRHRGLSRRAAKAHALSLLSAFRLPDAQRVYRAFPFQLSGGMARRAALAIAFAASPRLLVADEPTRGLDIPTRDAIVRTLRQTAEDLGTAILLVTHDLDVAGGCDRIAVLHRGRLVETGSPRDVLGRPCHPFTRQIVDARPENREVRP